MSNAITITCSATGDTREAKPGKSGNAKLPRGWKRMSNGEVLSPDGLRDRYRHVAIRCVIVGIIDDQTGNRATNERARELWRELREDVRRSEDDVSLAANRMLSAMYEQEPRKICRPDENGKVKLPSLPEINGYQIIREVAPELDTRSAVALAQRTRQLYAHDRWELLRGKRSLRTIRPDRQPVPIHNQGVALSYLSPADAVPILSLPIRGKRWRLALSVRQTDAARRGRVGLAKKRIAALIEGMGSIGEVMLMTRSQPGTNRYQSRGRTDLVAQIAAWVPSESRAEASLSGTLMARSAPDALLVCIDTEGERIWVLNADNLRRWQAEHRRRLSRWSDDQKREQRPIPTFAQRREDAVIKHHRRVRTALHEYAAQLVAYARRRRVASIHLDLTDRSYAGGELPWYELVDKIKQKAEQVGIVVEVAGGDVTSEDCGSLESE